LNHYFSGGDTDPAGMDVRFSRGTAFERKIWSTLREIKKGDTISYQQLGEKAEFPRSQRAVGGAMGRNYLLLFVPCHRVISKTNGLGGFSAGIKKKEFLLKLEDIF
jgi:methylated-DNA-[protein]-cysteine S-methyltransferase